MNLDWLTTSYLDFSYYILNDDLMAVQLVHDVAAKLALESPELLKEIKVRDHEILIFKNLFELGLSRITYTKSKMSVSEFKRKSSFYLSECLKFSVDEIAFISGLLPSKIVRDIEYSKFELFENNSIGQKINNEFSQRN